MKQVNNGPYVNWSALANNASLRSNTIYINIADFYDGDGTGSKPLPSKPSHLANLNTDLDQGMPVIIGGDNAGSNGGPHWMLAIRRNGSQYFANDPATGATVQVDLSKFQYAKTYYVLPSPPQAAGSVRTEAA